MSTVEARLPDSLYRQIRVQAEHDGISVDRLLATAASEKLSALLPFVVTSTNSPSAFQVKR